MLFKPDKRNMIIYFLAKIRYFLIVFQIFSSEVTLIQDQILIHVGDYDS